MGLSLSVVSAEVPYLDPSHRGCYTWDCPGPWGGSSAHDRPDPYVRERSRGYRTVTLEDSLTPTWHEVVATGLTVEHLAQPFAFEIVDDDRAEALDTNDPIAAFELRIRPEQLASGRFELRAAVGDEMATLVLEVR